MIIHYRFFHGPTDWTWVKKQIPGLLRSEDTTGLVAVDVSRGAEEVIVAAVVIDNVTINSCQAHFMSQTSAIFRHGWIEECAEYLFNFKGLKAVYGTVSSKNERALKINKRMGFTIKTELKDGYANGEHIIVMELLKKNCPFIPEIREVSNRGN